MKKLVKRTIFCIVVMLLGCTSVYAAELEQVQKNMVLEIAEETELLDTPEASATVVCTLQTGTTVTVAEDENNGWCKVSSQEKSGYVQVSKLKTLGNQSELDSEFEEISNSIQLMFDEIMLRENEEKQARIWGTIIVVLIVAIFGVGIVSAVKKNKEEKEN